RRGQLAVAAAVVEELHDGDRAVRVGDEIARIALQLVAVLAQGVGRGLGEGGLFLVAQLVRRLADHFGVLHQVGVHPLAERGVVGFLATDEGQGGGERQTDAENDLHVVSDRLRAAPWPARPTGSGAAYWTWPWEMAPSRANFCRSSLLGLETSTMSVARRQS